MDRKMSGRKYRKQEIPKLYHSRLFFIGQLLREYRWEAGYSRSEIQKEFGLHHRTVENIELGRNVSLVSLFRYLSCFNLDFSDMAFSDEEIE